MLTFNLMDARVVIAQFPNTAKDYAYFVPEGDNPQVGDVILTSTSWDTFGEKPANSAYRDLAMEARLARVTDVLEGGHPRATRFYMQLVSVAELKATHERNRELATRARAHANALASLDKMLERRSRLSIYQEMAANDPEAARLLAIIAPSRPVAPAKTRENRFKRAFEAMHPVIEPHDAPEGRAERADEA